MTGDRWLGYHSDPALFMDWSEGDAFTFEINPETEKFAIKLGEKALSVDNDGNLIMEAYDPTSLKQQWDVVSQHELLEQLRVNASETNPMDATFLIKGANFSRCDSDNDSWVREKTGDGTNATFWRTDNTGGMGRDNNYIAEYFNGAVLGLWDNGSVTEWTLKQNITNLPIGRYKLTYNGFRREGNASVKFGDKDAQTIMYIGDQYSETPLSEKATNSYEQTSRGKLGTGKYKEEKNTIKFNGYVPNDMESASDYFSAGYYVNTIDDILVTTGSAELVISKGSHTSMTWTAIDNFQLTYLGPTDETLASLDRVKEAIDDAQSKADAAGLTSYSNKAVVDAWENRLIQGDGSKEILRTYTSLATAALKQTEVPADLTYAIVNNSFEILPDYKNSNYNIGGGYPLGWTYPSEYKEDSGVWHYQNEYKAISNPDGEYIYNSWAWGENESAESGNTIYQELTLNPGIYKLSAKVSSHAGNMVYIYAGSNYAGVNATGKDVFVPVELQFNVSERTGVKIGVIGGAIGDNSFTTSNGRFYKADDFRLTKIADQDAAIGYELIKKAIADATKRVNAEGAPYNDGWAEKMQKYQDIIDNFTLEGNGEKEFYEIYELLRTAVFSKAKNPGTYFTNAIINNSFEFGDAYGWNVTFNGDTGVKPNSDGTYTISPVDGNYLFNTWQDDRGTIITQTIPNLPGGQWKLMAKAASDKNNYVYLEVIGQDGVESQKKQFQMANEKTRSQEIELTFNVADNTPAVTIAFGGCNGKDDYDPYGGKWYKIDDVRLQYVGDADLCFFYKRLLKAIEETTEVANTLDEKYSSQWDASDYQDLIDQHLKDGHDPDNPDKGEHGLLDPMGGSGIKEINELYSRLRELIFSQTETGADMTGSIVNNSFELGDLTGWTCNMDANADALVTAAENNDPYTTSGGDEELLFNCYSNGSARPIYQTIPNVPSGWYKLTAKIASDPGNKFYLGANDKHNEQPFVVTKNKDQFDEISFEFEVPVEAELKDVTIGLYPAINGGDEFSREDYPLNPGAWYKVDDFRLELVSRYLEVNWTMETDTHGTIMLPFDVKAEELAKNNLALYSVKWSEATDTPADEDINTYRILDWDGPLSGDLKANRPYVLKNIAPAVETASAKRLKAAEEGETNAPQRPTYKFSGYTSNERDTVTSYLLTGTLVDVPATSDQHHLQQIGDNVGFIIHADADANEVSHDKVEANHAYLYNPIKEYREFVTGFYFYEPIQDIDWEMETDNYGTLILPFNAELPEELVAHRLTGVVSENAKPLSLGESDGETYQVITLGEATNEIAKNTPYLVTFKSKSAAKRAMKRIKAEDTSNSNPTFKFSGAAENHHEEYKLDGLLTGVIVSRDDEMNGTKNSLDADGGDRVLRGNAENGYIFAAVSDRTPVTRYHAFIDSETAAGTHLLLEEPTFAFDWSREGGDYGTLVLPFEVEMSVLDDYELEAYTVTGAGSEVTVVNDNFAYQVLETTKVTDKLEANKPYMIIKKPESDLANSYEFSGERTTDETVVGNGILVGTYSNNIQVPEGDYILSDEGRGFEKQTRTDAWKDSALHAYLKGATIPGDGNTYLVLVDPETGEPTSVQEILAGEENVDIYTLQGVRVAHDVVAAEGLRDLEPGIYIIRTQKSSVKVIKK
ncbi:MAG: hypothetical protein K2G53_07380 [Muribaculaceae bacterium]|nr:hypothetical protein [Muribaculaceae bacterium]